MTEKQIKLPKKIIKIVIHVLIFIIQIINISHFNGDYGLYYNISHYMEIYVTFSLLKKTLYILE